MEACNCWHTVLIVFGIRPIKSAMVVVTDPSKDGKKERVCVREKRRRSKKRMRVLNSRTLPTLDWLHIMQPRTRPFNTDTCKPPTFFSTLNPFSLSIALGYLPVKAFLYEQHRVPFTGSKVMTIITFNIMQLCHSSEIALWSCQTTFSA